MNDTEREEMIQSLVESYISTSEYDEKLKEEIKRMEDEAISDFIADDLQEAMDTAIELYEKDDEPYTRKQVRQECINDFIEDGLVHFVDGEEASDNVLEEYEEYLAEHNDEELIEIYNRELCDE